MHAALRRRDLAKIQKDLDAFREIPFQTIQFLVEEAKVSSMMMSLFCKPMFINFENSGGAQDDVEEEENHGDAFHKFQAIEKKAVKAIFSSKVRKQS